jgi:hypothetical protein
MGQRMTERGEDDNCSIAKPGFANGEEECDCRFAAARVIFGASSVANRNRTHAPYRFHHAAAVHGDCG